MGARCLGEAVRAFRSDLWVDDGNEGLRVRGASLTRRSVYALLSPSLRACALVRLATAGGGRGGFYWLARNLLVAMHGIDIGRGATVGAGLRLPHPIGIVIGEGVTVGNNVTLYQNVTLGQHRGMYPRIHHDVTVFPGAVVVGDIDIGAGAVIGATAFIMTSVEPGARVHG